MNTCDKISNVTGCNQTAIGVKTMRNPIAVKNEAKTLSIAAQAPVVPVMAHNNHIITMPTKPDEIPEKWQVKRTTCYGDIFTVAYWSLMRDAYDSGQLNLQGRDDYIQFVRYARGIFESTMTQHNANRRHEHKPARKGSYTPAYQQASRERMEEVIARFQRWQFSLSKDKDTRLDMRVFVDGLYTRMENETISMYRLIRELMSQRVKLAQYFVPEDKPKQKRKTSGSYNNRVLVGSSVGKRKISNCPTVTIQWQIEGNWNVKEYKLSVKRNSHKDAIGWQLPKALQTFISKHKITNPIMQFVGISESELR